MTYIIKYFYCYLLNPPPPPTSGKPKKKHFNGHPIKIGGGDVKVRP